MALNLVGTSGNATIDASTGIDGFSITFDTWTTSTRPGSPTTGQTGFNTDLGYLESWNGSSWVGGLPSQSGNSGKFLTTNGSVASWADLPPTITNVSPSSFDGNAGQSFTVTGLSFGVGCAAIFIGNDSVTTYAATTTRNSATSLTVVNSVDMPISNEPYTLKVSNTDGAYALYPGIDAGGGPSWVTASGSLGSWVELTSVSTSVSATDPDAGSITYSSNDVGSGSLTWLSLNASTGALTGTAPDIASDTSYSFSITATDNAGNTSARSFSITVTLPVAPSTVEYLVVAGGGGGGAWAGGGGGGAGGLRTATGFAVSSGSAITVTVGAGGSASSGNAQNSTSGSNSVFSSITAAGGGVGGHGTSSPNTGTAGGSGGGGSISGASGGSGNTPSVSPSQGNAGGTGGTSNTGGGGGGAGAVGANASGNNPGNGGDGTASSITGSSVYYAGGGGGGRHMAAGSPSSGGNGGGGAGGQYSTSAPDKNGVAGTANTGGGGGGAGGVTSAAGADSGAGGSGIVVIRYSDAYTAAASTTGSPTYTVSGGYRIYTWTSSGSITF